MIHQNHLPLDQRREQARWKCAAIGGSRRIMVYLSCLRSSPAIRSMLGAPLVSHETPSVPASCFTVPHLAVGAIQTIRALPNQQQRGHLPCQLALHARSYCDRITRPICTLCLPIPTPDLGTPFSLKSSRFPYRKARSTKGVEACEKRSMAS